ncbi:MAG: ABC transporter permease [Cytophagales bacterium]|nr:MAG: ABC transporter permease [Cytophagales bacterium]
MLKFILQRFLRGILVIIGVIFVLFVLFYVLPGSPVDVITGGKATPETRAALIKELDLDKPVWQQFLYYLNDLSPLAVHHDTPERQKEYGYLKIIKFGENAFVLKFPYLRRSYSYQEGKLVSQILLEDMEGTLILAITSMFFATVIGVFLGTIAAVRQNTWVDYTLVTVSSFGISVPSFVLAILVAITFGHYLKDYTGLEMTGSLWTDNRFGKAELKLGNLILPTFTLAMRPLAIIVQLTRSSMIEVLSQDFIRTAKAKGLTFYEVIRKHALKNALNPVITAVSGWLASLMAGAFFIEYIFNWKGIGMTTVKAAADFRDAPVVIGATILIGIIFVIINILVDVIYALLDPRIRL